MWCGVAWCGVRFVCAHVCVCVKFVCVLWGVNLRAGSTFFPPVCGGGTKLTFKQHKDVGRYKA